MLIEQSLKDSELRYRRLFEAAQDGILILDAKTGMVEDVNPYLIKMLGYSYDEFVKKKLWEMGAFKDIEASQSAFEALQENEYIRYEDLPLKTKDGRMIEVEFVSNVYLAGDEKVIQCNIRENAEHKRIIAALQANEKKYHDLINQSPDGYFIIELSGHILTVNKAMCKELEFSEEEFLSMSIWDIIPQQFLDQYKERLVKILNGESLKEAAEYEVRGKDGKIHYVEVLSAPRYSGGDIIGFQGIARDISARRQAEDALRESERRFRLASWATKDVIWERNFAANTISWNESLQKLFHYSADEIEPTVDWWQDHIHPAERIKVINSIQTAIDQREDFWSKEYRFRLVDGSYADIFNRGYILYNEQGKPLQLIGAMVDVTEQKRAEEALRESEVGNRRLIEHLPTVVYMNAINDASSTIYVSPQIETLLGYTPQEWLADPELWSKTLYPEDRQRVLKQTAQTDQSKEPYEMEYRMIARDGSLVWVHDQIVLMKDLEGKPQFWQGIMLDITERKQAEMTLYESEERFKNAFQYSAIGMALVSLEGRWLKVNSTLCSIVGYSEEELLTQTFQAITHPDDLGTDLIYLGQLLAGEIFSYTMEKRYFHKEGKIVSVFLAVALARNNAGAPLYFISQMEDITERKQAEKKIRRQIDYLTALQDSDRTIASASDMHLSLNALISKAISLLAVDAAVVLLIDPTMNTLKFATGDGFRTNEIETINVKFDESYAGRAALERRIAKIPNMNGEPHNLLFTKFLKVEGFIGYYGVPLIVKGKVIGMLEVFQRSLIKHDQEWLDFLNALAGQAAIAISTGQLFDNLQHSNQELSLAYDATIEGWSRALDLRDKETEGHSLRVTEMTVNLARDFDFNEAELVQVRWGSLLHDIGKMGVPDGILFKPGALTEEEWLAMKKHPTFAYEMLAPIRYLRLALDIPYCHHEKWNGTGYPRGLKGNQIPPTARIFAVVDVWDALRSDRPYRAAWPVEKVREHIRALSGTHFDPQVVDRFLQMPN